MLICSTSNSPPLMLVRRNFALFILVRVSEPGLHAPWMRPGHVFVPGRRARGAGARLPRDAAQSAGAGRAE